MPSRPRLLSLVVLPLLLALLAACAEETPTTPAKAKRSSLDHLVNIYTIKTERISGRHESTGDLRYRRQVHIHTQEEGRIDQLPWFEGDMVKAGDLLVQLEADLIQAELDKASATARQARLDLRRNEDLVKTHAISEDELARSRTAFDVAVAEKQLLATRLKRTVITAPFDAIVTERLAEPGDVVERYGHLMTLADPASLMTEARVSELLLPHLHVGDPVAVRIDALGAKEHPGRILRIHPEIDAATRRGVVEVTLDPVPPGAQAGQFARLRLEGEAVSRMLVPFNALRRDRQGEFVFVERAGKAVRVPVESGQRFADRIEIMHGLKPGQRVIYRGFIGITDGKNVKVVPDPL